MTIVTLVLAIIGAVTGLTSILLQFASFLQTDARLKIIFDSHRSFFIKNESLTSKPFGSQYAAVVSFKFMNDSSHPITVDSVYFKSPIDKEFLYSLSTYPLKDQVEIPINTPPNEIKKHVNVFLHRQGVFPLRIDGYDSIPVSIAIPKFDEFINEYVKPTHDPMDETINNLKLYALTPRKTFKLNFSLQSSKINASLVHEDIEIRKLMNSLVESES